MGFLFLQVPVAPVARISQVSCLFSSFRCFSYFSSFLILFYFFLFSVVKINFTHHSLNDSTCEWASAGCLHVVSFWWAYTKCSNLQVEGKAKSSEFSQQCTQKRCIKRKELFPWQFLRRALTWREIHPGCTCKGQSRNNTVYPSEMNYVDSTISPHSPESSQLELAHPLSVLVTLWLWSHSLLWPASEQPLAALVKPVLTDTSP